MTSTELCCGEEVEKKFMQSMFVSVDKKVVFKGAAALKLSANASNSEYTLIEILHSFLLQSLALPFFSLSLTLFCIYISLQLQKNILSDQTGTHHRHHYIHFFFFRIVREREPV